MAKDEQTGEKTSRIAQVRAAYRMTKRSDRRIGLVLLGVFLGTVAVFVLLGMLIGLEIYFTILGVMMGLLVTTMVFGRRAERAAFSQMQGALGAAYAALQTLRKGWVVTPGVAVNKDQAIVHRAVGRPGVVLVGEGAPGRLAPLLAQEKKKYSRIVPDVPVYDMQAGDGEGQVPLRRLTRDLMKLPRNITAGQVSEVEKRVKAVGSLNMPIPKGPLPRNARMPRSPKIR